MKHRVLEHIAALFVPAVCFLIFALPAGAQGNAALTTVAAADFAPRRTRHPKW